MWFKKIPCACGKFYIGETSRPLNIRLNEHKSYFKKREFQKSKICQHAWDSGHKIKWNNSRILLKEVATKKIKIKETASIMLNNDNCIATSLIKIKPLWLPILKDDLDIGIQV